MTTHVFIVDERTFKCHLEYLFVGTGSRDNDVDFNNSSTTNLHFGVENMLVGMMADGCRLREGDFVLFYLQAQGTKEGKFYGIFKVKNDGVFIDNKGDSQYLYNELGKNLTFRKHITPFRVYPEGVTEWEALDEIKNTPAPCQMIWSLIYRKLKGNRGNTMVTIFEAEKLFDLIRNKNNNTTISNTEGLSFDGQKIINSESKKYNGTIQRSINILPRLIDKYNRDRAHEAHLQMIITQNIGCGTIPSLDSALNANRDNIEWIGNEVSCGVGMQRIDIMLSQKIDDTQRNIIPIELKAVPSTMDNIRQINRYIDWIEQYYNPNRPSLICPTLICKKHLPLDSELKSEFHKFNELGRERYQPLTYIEYEINNSNIIFNKVSY